MTRAEAKQKALTVVEAILRDQERAFTTAVLTSDHTPDVDALDACHADYRRQCLAIFDREWSRIMVALSADGMVNSGNTKKTDRKRTTTRKRT